MKLGRTPTAVFKAKDNTKLDQWEQERVVHWNKFREQLQEFLTELGKADAYTASNYGGTVVLGYHESDPKEGPLPGWRRSRDYNGYMVPALRTKEGKAARDKMQAIKYNPPRPGVPEVVWGAGYMGGMAVQKLGDQWYAWCSVPLRDEGEGKTGLESIDKELWEESKLSDFFLAVEAMPEEEADG